MQHYPHYCSGFRLSSKWPTSFLICEIFKHMYVVNTGGARKGFKSVFVPRFSELLVSFLISPAFCLDMMKEAGRS